MQISLKRPEDREELKFNDEENKYTWKDFLSDAYQKKWIRYGSVFIIVIVAINFWIFRYDDFKNNCHVKINLSLLEWNNLEIKRAVKFLKNNSPKDYHNFCTNVDRISPDLPCGGSGGGCYRPEYAKQIEISTMNHKENSAITAAMIVHEVCHAIQNAEKGKLNEPECYGEMNRMLGELGIDSPWKDYK